MPLESGTYVDDLVVTNPAGATDSKSQGDDHIRLIKTALKNTFPGANRAIKFGELPGAIEAKAANYTVVAADAGKLFDCTAALTLNLTAAATLGANFAFRAYNSSAGVVTVDPAGAELVNGVATITLEPGEFIYAICTGVVWEVARAGVALGRANIFTALQTVALTSLGAALLLQLTEASASDGPNLRLTRISSSPLANDLGGVLEWYMSNSTPTEVLAVDVKPEMITTTAGNEDFRFNVRTRRAGAIAARLRIGSGIYTPNALNTEPGADKFNALDYKINDVSILASLRGYIDGLVLSNNGADALNDIDIAVGAAMDDTTASMMVLSGALVKRLDATFVAGTNQGMLDTGAEASSTWYHIFLIRNPTTGAVDILASTSVSAPTMPSGFTQKRIIGSIFNDSGSAIKAFSQFGNEFRWLTAVLDVDVAQDTTRTLRTLTVPTGRKVWAMMNYFSPDGDNGAADIDSPDVTDLAPSDTAAPLNLMSTRAAALTHPSGYVVRRTNTSGQVTTDANIAALTIRIATLGWMDPRGQNA